jgi:hypothetical protein
MLRVRVWRNWGLSGNAAHLGCAAQDLHARQNGTDTAVRGRQIGRREPRWRVNGGPAHMHKELQTAIYQLAAVACRAADSHQAVPPAVKWVLRGGGSSSSESVAWGPFSDEGVGEAAGGLRGR